MFTHHSELLYRIVSVPRHPEVSRMYSFSNENRVFHELFMKIFFDVHMTLAVQLIGEQINKRTLFMSEYTNSKHGRVSHRWMMSLHPRWHADGIGVRVTARAYRFPAYHDSPAPMKWPDVSVHNAVFSRCHGIDIRRPSKGYAQH